MNANRRMSILTLTAFVLLGGTGTVRAVAIDEPPRALELTRPGREPGSYHDLDMDPVVRFEGREYAIEDAIPFLAKIATDPQAETRRRGKAAGWLYAIAKSGHPAVTEYVPALVRTYLGEHDTSNKVTLLLCISACGDRSTLGFFEHLLDVEQDERVRLAAGLALAQWNARPGVEALVGLLGSKTMLGERRLAGEAGGQLFRCNKAQGWGAPFKSMTEELQGSYDVSSTAGAEQATAALAQKMQEWFAANKERFPEVPTDDRERWRAALALPSELGQSAMPPGTSQSASRPVREATTRPVAVDQPAASHGVAAVAQPPLSGVPDQPAVGASAASEPATSTATRLANQGNPVLPSERVRQPSSGTPSMAEAPHWGAALWVGGGALVLIGAVVAVALRSRRICAR